MNQSPAYLQTYSLTHSLTQLFILNVVFFDKKMKYPQMITIYIIVLALHLKILIIFLKASSCSTGANIQNVHICKVCLVNNAFCFVLASSFASGQSSSAACLMLTRLEINDRFWVFKKAIGFKDNPLHLKVKAHRLHAVLKYIFILSEMDSNAIKLAGCFHFPFKAEFHLCKN